MEINFMTNDYLLIWNFLFGASMSKDSHLYKQKMWTIYKKQYNAILNDKKILLNDIKDFIPDDDTLYNIISETNIFSVIKRQSEKHRMFLLKTWDENKKRIKEELKKILKFKVVNDYQIIILHPLMDTILTEYKCKNIGWGLKEDLKDRLFAICNIVFNIIKLELKNFQEDYKEIVDCILELAIKNEVYTRITNKSNYEVGDKQLKFLKKQIYPYWLMYLGIEKEKFLDFMRRDNIVFDIDKYDYEEDLQHMDLISFIDFCIKNQKRIIRINNLEII